MRPSEVSFLCEKIMSSGEIPLVWGHFGVGKTDLAKQIAKKYGKELIILVISQMEPGDLIGLPSRDVDRTTFLKPDWWPEHDEVIIMIDEINRAHKSIRNAIMQLLIDKRIHNHILPENVWIMAAANPPDEEYDQVDLITDPAFMSRFFHIDLSTDLEDWKNWAFENEVSNQVINFIDKYPEFLSYDNSISLRLDLRPSPRSWFKLSNVMKNLTEEEIEKYNYFLSSSILGSEGARALNNYFKNKTNIPTAEEILFKDSIEKIQSFNSDDKMSVILRLNSYFEKIEESRMIEIIDNSQHKLIAKKIKELSAVLPRDAVFSVLRNLNFLVENNKGLKKAFYDKLLEEIAITLGDEKWLEEV